MNLKKRLTSALAAVALVAVALTACSSGGTSSSTSSSATKGPYKVALSMSYSGNDWQDTSRNLIEAAAKSTPLKSEISKLSVSVAGTDAQTQIAQLQQMIVSGYNAIIVYPISPTALNPTIKQACAAGIVIITYDASVTEPCAYHVSYDQEKSGEVGASYLAGLMHNKGNVVMITGVAGTTTDNDRNAGAEKVFKERGIKVLSTCAGNWAEGPAGECMSRLLSSFPNIDGVWAQSGGVALTGAFDAAGRKYVPIVGEAENSWRLALVDPAYKAKGLVGGSMGSPQYQGAAALESALQILDGKKLSHFINVGYDWKTQDQIKVCKTGTVAELTAGCNTFPAGKVSDSFFADWYSAKYTSGMDLNTALTGKLSN